MSKRDRQKKRGQRRLQKPSAPRQIGSVIGANDNTPEAANDNAERPIISGIQLTQSQADRLAAAEADLASRDHDRQKAGRAVMLALEAEITRAVNAGRVKADLEETLALEGRRGAEWEVSDRQEHRGRVRITSRDGLETMLTAKSITLIQHAAGLRFRDDYETLDPEKGLTPPSIDQSRNPVRGGEGWAQKRAERERFVADLERMIQAEDPTFRGANGRSEIERIGRAVWALRQIAGKGANLLALSASGSVQARTSEALILALDCAAIAYGLE